MRAQTRHSLLFGTALALGGLPPLTAADPIVTSDPVSALSGDEYAKQAKEEWEAIPDKTDDKALDYYIHTFEESDGAVDAFTIRLEVVRGSGSIPDYNEFINTYADRMAAQLAIGEVYQLYRKQDRLSGYADFINRYPNTPEAGVARLHAQNIGFEFATLVDNETAMNEFMLSFPEAPQVFAASDLAREMSLEQHKQEYAEVSKRMSKEDRDDWVNRRLRAMRFEYRDLWTALNQETPSPQILDFLERDVLGYRPEQLTPGMRQYLADRMQRIYYVVRWFKPYQTAEASDEIVAEARHQELIAKLEEIRQTLEKNHQELISEMKKEMEATRGVLRAGFEELANQHKLDRQTMEKGFAQMKTSMDQLHNDMGAIYGELRNMHGTLQNIDQRIAQTNQSLAKIDQRLVTVQNSIVSMHNDMNKGFTGVQNRISRLNNDLNQGFAKQHAIATAQLNVANQSLAVQKQSVEMQAQTLSAINYGFNKLDNTMQSGFTQLDSTMQSGFTRLEEATWESATMVAESNRQMVANMQPAQQAQDSGGFFSKALGTVGEFVPVVGPIVGDMAGTLLDDVVVKGIKGEKIDPLSVGREMLVGAVDSKLGDKFPGASAMAGNLFDSAVGEKRLNYEQVGGMLSRMGGIGDMGSIGGGGGGGGSISDYTQEAWYQLKEKAVTPENFKKVGDVMAERYNIPPEAVDFAADRIF